MRILSLSSVLVCALCPNVLSWAPPSQRVRREATSLHMVDMPSRRSALVQAASLALLVAAPSTATARLESVNRPDLLPSEPGVNVIQVEKFLTTGQARRMNELLGNLEKDTGYRVKVLCQRYPYTPGLAIRDYWSLGTDVSTNGFFSIPMITLSCPTIDYFPTTTTTLCSLLTLFLL